MGRRRIGPSSFHWSFSPLFPFSVLLLPSPFHTPFSLSYFFPFIFPLLCPCFPSSSPSLPLLPLLFASLPLLLPSNAQCERQVCMCGAYRSRRVRGSAWKRPGLRTRRFLGPGPLPPRFPPPASPVSPHPVSSPPSGPADASSLRCVPALQNGQKAQRYFIEGTAVLHTRYTFLNWLNIFVHILGRMKAKITHRK